MGIALMADIENDLIAWRIKHTVQSDRQFHNAEIGSEMASVFRNRFYQLMPNFAAKLIEFPVIQLFQICRGMDLLKNLGVVILKNLQILE